MNNDMLLLGYLIFDSPSLQFICDTMAILPTVWEDCKVGNTTIDMRSFDFSLTTNEAKREKQEKTQLTSICFDEKEHLLPIAGQPPTRPPIYNVYTYIEV